MRATNWEFTNRALVFGVVVGAPFALYLLDPVNAVAALSEWLASRWRMAPDDLARVLFVLASLVLGAAALLRTWASSYLNAGVVYASKLKSASLVADGPYRHVRNPLYFANALMVVGLGTMMSRAGFIIVIPAMVIFCYRLILREESELSVGQGESYLAYCRAVPRLWPALSPRVPPSGRRPAWKDGFQAETWCWGYAAALLGFAITLKLPVFFALMGASFAWFWISSSIVSKKA